MKRHTDESEGYTDLRRRAEAALKDGAEPDVSAMSADEVAHVVHELRTHQIELEMQNEELRHAQTELEAARDRYMDLYDFAPAGYVTVSTKGLILEANLTISDMLGVTRTHMINRRFSDFITDEDQDVYYLVRQQDPGRKAQQRCDARMFRKDGDSFWARIEGVVVNDACKDDIRIRYAINDITELKQAEEKRHNESDNRYQALYFDSQRQHQELELLDQVRTSLIREFDPSSIYRLTVDNLAETYHYPIVGISLLCDDMLIHHYYKGSDLFVERSSIFQGITGRVARRGGPELVEDAHADPDFIGWDKVVSEICVPLFRNDAVVGVLNVETIDDHRLSEEDLRIILAISEHVSMALDRAQIYTDLRGSEARLRSLTSALSLAEEQERRRIASELHDSLGPSLSVIDMKLETLLSSKVSSDLTGPVREIQGMVNDITQHIRSLTFQLSPPVLYEFGLESAVEWLTEDIQQRYGLQCACEYDRQVASIREDLRALLFISTRELLLNIVKHARAQQVRISIRRKGADIRISIADDGVGFVYDPDAVSAGFGLFSIRERLKHMKGHLEIDTEPGHGARITLIAPLQGGEEGEKGDQDSHSR